MMVPREEAAAEGRPAGPLVSDALERRVVAWRRYLHRHPEPGFGEFQTTDFLSRTLAEMGYAVRTADEAMDVAAVHHRDADKVEESLHRAAAAGVQEDVLRRMHEAGTALVADLGVASNPLLALRVDIDALPFVESADAGHAPVRGGFRSLHDGLMHACGHDGHMAVALGVAAILAEHADRLNGSVRLIFQPAEEGTMGGAAAIARRGLVDDVDDLLCFHLGLGVPTGEVVRQARFLATSKYAVEFIGTQAHVTNSPQSGRNALLAAASAALALHAIAPHCGGWSNLNVGVLEAGSEQGVTPASASMKLGFWAETSEVHDYLDAQVDGVLSGSAATWGVSVSSSLMGRAPTAEQDESLSVVVGRCAERCPDVRRVVDSTTCKAGEDANVLIREVASHGGRGLYTIIGSDLAAGHHTPSFDFDEASLRIGVDVLARTCLTLLDVEAPAGSVPGG